jgi:hypothetical protein
MRTYQTKLIALLAVATLFVIGALVSSRQAVADASKDVVISAPLPLPVTGNITDADNPDRQPFQKDLGPTLQDTQSGAEVVVAVQSGKRLVLTYVSAQIQLPPGQMPSAQIACQDLVSNQVVAHVLPFTLSMSPVNLGAHPTDAQWVLQAPFQCYASGASALHLNILRNATAGSRDAHWGITGHLVTP